MRINIEECLNATTKTYRKKFTDFKQGWEQSLLQKIICSFSQFSATFLCTVGSTVADAINLKNWSRSLLEKLYTVFDNIFNRMKSSVLHFDNTKRKYPGHMTTV